MALNNIIKQNRFAYESAIMNADLDKQVAQASKCLRVYGDSSQIEALRDDFGALLVELAERMNSNKYRRTRRIRDRIGDYFDLAKLDSLGIELVWLTLTFTDETLSSTNAATRRVYVTRWLKSVSSVYVANIDFGKLNEREHYHALVVNRIDLESLKEWHKFGAIKVERVKTDFKNLERSKKAIPKYIAKLTNHAVKETASRGPRIIYSRKRKLKESERF